MWTRRILLAVAIDLGFLVATLSAIVFRHGATAALQYAFVPALALGWVVAASFIMGLGNELLASPKSEIFGFFVGLVIAALAWVARSGAIPAEQSIMPLIVGVYWVAFPWVLARWVFRDSSGLLKQYTGRAEQKRLRS